jgi:hypothetical protein
MIKYKVASIISCCEGHIGIFEQSFTYGFNLECGPHEKPTCVYSWDGTIIGTEPKKLWEGSAKKNKKVF